MSKKKTAAEVETGAAAPPQASQAAPSAVNPTGRKTHTYKTLREGLAQLNWPMTATAYERVMQLGGSSARMWIAKFKEKGDLIQFEDGEYSLPGTVMVVKPDPLTPLRAALAQMNWPMTRSQFIREITRIEQGLEKGERPRQQGLAVFNNFMREKLLTEVAPRLYAFHKSQVVRDPRIKGAAMGMEADLRLRFPRLLNTLPVDFTSAQFAQAGDMDAKHANTVLSRMAKSEMITRQGRGEYSRTFKPLPLSFTLSQFAVHFGFEEDQAAKVLGELITKNRMNLPDGQVYTVSKKVMAELEYQWHDSATAPFDHVKQRERMNEVPTMPWPMSVDDYVRFTGLSKITARVALNRYVLIGLLVQDHKQGRVHMYSKAPEGPFKVSPRNAQKALNSANGMTGNRLRQKEVLKRWHAQEGSAQQAAR